MLCSILITLYAVLTYTSIILVCINILLKNTQRVWKYILNMLTFYIVGDLMKEGRYLESSLFHQLDPEYIFVWATVFAILAYCTLIMLLKKLINKQNLEAGFYFHITIISIFFFNIINKSTMSVGYIQAFHNHILDLNTHISRVYYYIFLWLLLGILAAYLYSHISKFLISVNRDIKKVVVIKLKKMHSEEDK